MFKNYLKITFRNMMKNKLFVLINIVGLGIALSCCIVAYLNWEYNAKFDTNYVGTEDVYRLNFKRITNGTLIQNGNCPMPLAAEIESGFPQVEEVARCIPLSGNFKRGSEVFRTDIAAVDPAFFDLFKFELQAGQMIQPTDKQSIVISSTLQEKYFPGQANPVGESLTYLVGDQELIYQIVGVYTEPPKNSSFSSEAYIPFENALEVQGWEADNWAYFNTTFLRVPNAGQLAQVEQQLQAHVEVQNQAKEDYKVDSYYLDPFVGMAVRAERENTWNHWFRNSLPIAAAVSPGIMAFLILLIACFNFTNTSIAIANRRIKEIGIRKVLGSGRRQLITQFLGENTFLVILSLLVGLIISVYFVPAYSAMWPFLEIKLNLIENADLVLFLLGLLLFAALIAGSYPAFYISSFQPTTILRGRVRFSGTNSLTRILLTLQFAISLLAVIAGFVFTQNAQFQAEYDMGYDLDQTVIAYVKNEQGYQKMVNQLQGYDQIKEIAGSANSIRASWYTDPIRYNNSEELDVNIFDIGTNYLQAVGASLVAGRDFVPNSRSDMDNSVLVNEELVKTMGWTEPLGQRIIVKDTIALNVIGVVKNIHYEGGLWRPLEPMLMRYIDQPAYTYLSVRTSADDLLAVKQIMDEKWAVVFPSELSQVEFMDEGLSEMTLVNSNIRTLFIALGLIAVFLSVIGLFSLVSLNLVKRMKEIGVRKVLGASVANISLRVSREFFIILLVASVIGAVGAFYLTEMLLSSIWAYHVPLRIWPFLASILLLFAASVVTIGGKVVRAASTNPALILKDE